MVNVLDRLVCAPVDMPAHVNIKQFSYVVVLTWVSYKESQWVDVI